MFKSGVSIVFLISLSELVMSFSDENKALIQSTFVNAGQKCVIEHPITEEDIAEFKERRFPEGRTAACFSACVLEDIGLLDDKGAISQIAFERAKEVFKDEEEQKTVQDFFDTCTKNQEAEEADACDRAKVLFRCFVENSEKFGF